MVTRKALKFNHALLLGSLAWLGLVLFLLPPVARAEYVVYDAKVDAYHVTVWARPNPISVGKVSLLIRLGRQVNVSQEYPVREAQVSVLFKQLTGPGTEPGSKIENYHKTLAANEAGPGTYEMEDSLLSDGRYQTLITISSNVGKSETSFEFVAQPQPDDRFFSLLLLALFPTALLTLVYFYVRRPRNNGETGGPVAEPTPEPQPQEIPPR